MTRPFVGYHCGSEQFAPNELVELAVQAEHAGFQGVTVSDHFHPWQDNQGHAGHAWAMLAAIGARTERLLMGTGVTCPTYRVHPAQVAHAFATLGALYPGRVFLGVGTGEAVNEAPFAAWGRYKERAERLVEAIELIRRLWSGDWVDFEGQYYQARGAKLYDVPLVPIPIYVAASGVQGCRITGAHGDGWITDHNTIRRGEAQKRSFADAALATGKRPDEMPRIVELWAVVGERDEAIQAARKWQFILAFNEVVDVADPREVQRLAEARVSPEEAADAWVVSRDPDAHIAAIRELAAAGATHVFLHSPQPDQRAAIEFYGRHVLPKLS
jgi:TAT-translocated FGD2 family F420-dependent dehydrogenase